jgi:hypothetical protein
MDFHGMDGDDMAMVRLSPCAYIMLEDLLVNTFKETVAAARTY